MNKSKILFLDIDGVLNSDAYFTQDKWRKIRSIDGGNIQAWKLMIDKEPLSYLEDVVDLTDCNIIIHSSWRKQWPLKDLITIFNERGFSHSSKIIGIAPYKLSSTREHDIKFALEEHKPERFIVLDDYYLPSLAKNLIQTDSCVGLTKVDAIKAIDMLSGK